MTTQVDQRLADRSVRMLPALFPLCNMSSRRSCNADRLTPIWQWVDVGLLGGSRIPRLPHNRAGRSGEGGRRRRSPNGASQPDGLSLRSCSMAAGCWLLERGVTLGGRGVSDSSPETASALSIVSPLERLISPSPSENDAVAAGDTARVMSREAGSNRQANRQAKRQAGGQADL